MYVMHVLFVKRIRNVFSELQYETNVTNSTNRSSKDAQSIYLCQNVAANSIHRSDKIRFVILFIESCNGDIGVTGDKYPHGVVSVPFFLFPKQFIGDPVSLFDLQIVFASRDIDIAVGGVNINSGTCSNSFSYSIPLTCSLPIMIVLNLGKIRMDKGGCYVD